MYCNWFTDEAVETLSILKFCSRVLLCQKWDGNANSLAAENKNLAHRDSIPGSQTVSGPQRNNSEFW